VGRQREIAIRLSLGANRARIIRQLLTESMMLATLGGVVGLLVALLGKSLLVVNDSGLPRVEEISIDGRVLGFTLALSLLTGLIFGLVPALQVSKPNLNELLKDGGAKGGMEGSHRHRLCSLLVISEVALSLMLLISAGLMLKSFQRLTKVDPGFRSDNVMTAEISLPKSKYSQDQQITRFYQQLLERVASSPGVRSAGIVTCLPMSGADSNTGFFIEGRPLPGPGEMNHTYYRSVSPDYFNAMGVPLVKGRHFTEQDSHDAPKVAIINETMAHRFWPDEDPLGKRLALDFEAMTFDTTKGAQLDIAGTAREIIGVVKDIRHSGLDGRFNPETYVSYSQLPSPAMTLVTRSSASTLNAVAVMRNQVWAIDKDLPLSKVRTMEKVMSESLAEQRFRTTLLGGFALVALLLATAGVYGVISYSVTQRTREIAVRIALGALPADILNLVVRRGFRLLMIGIAFGIGGALVINRTLSTLLFEVSAYDPVIFAGFSLVLASAALIASYIPARKATKIEPMISLKTE
jgi:putative ABC transport system permease protein